MNRRKSLSLACALALVAALLPFAAGTPPASAATSPQPVSGDVNLLFSRGGDPARYPANSVVRIDAGNINFVKGCVPGPSGRGYPDYVQASADLYIVPSGRAFTDRAVLSDALGAPNTVFAGLGGSFLYEPLARTGAAGGGAGLPSGTYDVVVDECQNGIFDEVQDTVVRNAFRVDLDQVVPGFDFESAQFSALKSRAQRQLGGNSQIESVLDQILILELYNQVKSIVEAPQNVVNFATFVTKMLVPSLDPIAALQNRGRIIVKNSAQKRRINLYNMTLDPPDADFQVSVSPTRDVPVAIPPVPELAMTYDALSVFDAIAATEVAFLAALEKYQGAQEAGNPAWAARHARALDELATLHDELSQAFVTLITPVAQEYGATAGRRAEAFDLAFLFNTTFESWALGGYASDQEWNDANLDPATTSAALSAFRDEVSFEGANDAGNLTVTADSLTPNAQAIRDMSTDLRAWVDSAVPGVLAEITPVLSALETDFEADIETVTGAAAGVAVTLGVDLPADVTPDTIGWDLDGDGAFDDAFGPTPTWVVPAGVRAGVPYVIAVEVIAGLRRDVAYEIVTPGAGNAAPVVTRVGPDPATGAPGTTSTFEISASDPDGDATTTEWYVDGTLAQTGGSTFDLAVPNGYYGQYGVSAVVTDALGNQALAVWSLLVLSGVDDDNDGFQAFPGSDCDDTSAQVNPNRSETVGNGIDDDCDPSTPDGGTPVNPGFPSPRTFGGVEGETFVYDHDTWNHPNRTSGQPFTLVVEWGDGTTSTQTVAGTTRAETRFLLEHTYTDELSNGDLRWCISNGSDPEGCGIQEQGINIANEAPFVGAGDLRDWGKDWSGENPEQCSSTDCDPGDWEIHGDGLLAYSPTNSNERYVLHSPVQLAESGYGRGMVELSVPFQSGDDDMMGFVVGYDTDDITGFDGTADDYVDFEWYGRARGRQTGESATSPARCNGTNPSPADTLVDTATVARVRGPMHSLERTFNLTFAVEGDGSGPVPALCNDEFGPDELLVIDMPNDEPNRPTTSERWLGRAIDPADADPTRIADAAYTYTFDYRADRFRVWSDTGVLIVDVAPRSAADPFPPGALGLIHHSQIGVRAKGTAPEREIGFTQGTPGMMQMPFTDGGDDEFNAVIDWGDGSNQSAGVVTADPATGVGWHLVTAEHAYLRAGTFRGEVCVVDDRDDGSCFTFRAVVDNVAPTVEAGPDIEGEADLVSGATVSLDQAFFTDPGTFDDHTATVDWGDGSPTEAATVTGGRSAGGIITASHTYAADGVYDVEVCVTDQAGGVGCDTVEVDVRVTNRAPSITADVPDSELIGVLVPIGGGFTDANPDDTFTVTVDPGDGTGPVPADVTHARGTGSGGIEHTYSVPGTYAVTVCVSDAAGLTDCATAPFDAVDDGTFNQPPVADAGGPYEVDEGSTVTLDASGSTDPDGDPLSAAWDLDGDGTFETSGESVTFAGDDGPTTDSPTVEVCDPAAACDTASATVTVRNVAPVLGTPTASTSGLQATVSVAFTDPGLPDTHTTSIDWDDGTTDVGASTSPGGGIVSGSHVYDDAGSYTVVVTVIDDDNGAASVSVPITVGDSPPPTGNPCADLTPTIVGTPKSEKLYGTNGDDVIFAGAGNDKVYGLGGNDVICGGPGNDHLHGGDGDDFVAGEEGNDHLSGGRGADELDGGAGNDNVRGGDGDDLLRGGPGNDRLVGGRDSSVGDGADGGPGRDQCRESERRIDCEVGGKSHDRQAWTSWHTRWMRDHRAGR